MNSPLPGQQTQFIPLWIQLDVTTRITEKADCSIQNDIVAFKLLFYYSSSPFRSVQVLHINDALSLK